MDKGFCGGAGMKMESNQLQSKNKKRVPEPGNEPKRLLPKSQSYN